MNSVQRALAAERRTTGAPHRDRIRAASRGARPDARFADAFAAPRAADASAYRASSGTPGIAARIVNADNRNAATAAVADSMTLLARETGWAAVGHHPRGGRR